MAFGRLERTPARAPMSDINMTPLIDVMLVLLVIFIITAPLMASQPEARPAARRRRHAQRRAEPSSRWRSMPTGGLFIGDEPTAREALVERVRAAARRNPATEVQLRADQPRALRPRGRAASAGCRRRA